jgi:hypothetical protein
MSAMQSHEGEDLGGFKNAVDRNDVVIRVLKGEWRLDLTPEEIEKFNLITIG